MCQVTDAGVVDLHDADALLGVALRQTGTPDDDVDVLHAVETFRPHRLTGRIDEHDGRLIELDNDVEIPFLVVTEGTRSVDVVEALDCLFGGTDRAQSLYRRPAR